MHKSTTGTDIDLDFLDSYYVYHILRQLYVSEERKQIISVEFIEKYGTEKVKNLPIPDEWTFYFTEEPSKELREDLLEDLNLLAQEDKGMADQETVTQDSGSESKDSDEEKEVTYPWPMGKGEWNHITFIIEEGENGSQHVADLQQNSATMKIRTVKVEQVL